MSNDDYFDGEGDFYLKALTQLQAEFDALPQAEKDKIMEQRKNSLDRLFEIIKKYNPEINRDD